MIIDYGQPKDWIFRHIKLIKQIKNNSKRRLFTVIYTIFLALIRLIVILPCFILVSVGEIGHYLARLFCAESRDWF